ncbi:ABC transporter permease [Paenibacillus gansuensis]|uniref:ABC transporter permease n=1 Tax=Paenibacillus gansuensis TaxID=306542 RepID=A0ABW5PFV3_9BACL
MSRLLFRFSTLQYMLMLLPGLVLLALFSLKPMLGILIAFQSYIPGKGIWHSPFVGLDNFKVLFSSSYSWQVIENTIIISLAKMIAFLIIPVLFALMLNELKLVYFKRMVQTIVYLPHFLSWVIIAGILKDMLGLDGLVNQSVIIPLGFEPISFLGSNLWFRPILISTDVWKEFGFSAIVYLAALTNINPTLYEAAEMDGASRLQKLWHISLPGISSTIVLLATLSLQNVLNAGFDQIFNLYNPTVYSSGDILDTYIYRVSFEQVNYELATAVGLFKSVISMALIVTAYKLASRFAGYRIF